MYTKSEAKAIRQEYWNQFKTRTGALRTKKGKKGRWLMNETGIKQIHLKFHFDEHIALTGIEIETRNTEKRYDIWNKFESLRKILEEHADFPIFWEKEYRLDTSKIVSRIFSKLGDVNIYNRQDWKRVNDFFYTRMTLFEDFFLEYRDYLKHNNLH